MMRTKEAKALRGYGAHETVLYDSIEKNSLGWTKSVNEIQRFSGKEQGSQVKEQEFMNGDVFDASC
jgi:hypothetical protein